MITYKPRTRSLRTIIKSIQFQIGSFELQLFEKFTDMSNSSSEEEVKVINDQLAYLTEEIVSTTLCAVLDLYLQHILDNGH